MTGDTPYSSGIGVRPITPADTAEICDLLEHGFGIAADDWRPLYTCGLRPVAGLPQDRIYGGSPVLL